MHDCPSRLSFLIHVHQIYTLVVCRELAATGHTLGRCVDLHLHILYIYIYMCDLVNTFLCKHLSISTNISNL